MSTVFTKLGSEGPEVWFKASIRFSVRAKVSVNF